MRSKCSEATRARVSHSATATLGLLFVVALSSSTPSDLQAAGEQTVVETSNEAGGATAEAAENVTAVDVQQMPEEQKQKVKSVVLMLSILSGIALSGLLLIIAAIVIRGLQHKLAGPTRLDPRPQDVLSQAIAQPGAELAAAVPPADSDGAAEETRFT
ncbi:MAG: hypothetical protein JNG89_01725 [Planctomycetaceae bacterium]|nr:hypothetical protein [Planctomycetaceae bacterium]